MHSERHSHPLGVWQLLRAQESLPGPTLEPRRPQVPHKQLGGGVQMGSRKQLQAGRLSFTWQMHNSQGSPGDQTCPTGNSAPLSSREQPGGGRGRQWVRGEGGAHAPDTRRWQQASRYSCCAHTYAHTCARTWHC